MRRAERKESVQWTLLAKEPDGVRLNFNWRTMSIYEIKTHRSGKTYRTERKEIVQWTILVKEPAGAWGNRAEPLNKPCPNCFVITTAAEPTRESLYYLCLLLKIGKYFSYYLKGSVIPFICISDAKKVINQALQNN